MNKANSKENFARLKNIKRYPAYIRRIFVLIFVKLDAFFIRHICSRLVFGEGPGVRNEWEYDYLATPNDVALLSFKSEVLLFREYYRNQNSFAVRPPYFNCGKPPLKNIPLIAVPGPFYEDSELEKLYSFWEIVSSVIKERRYTKLYFRFHPRQKQKIKVLIKNKLFQKFPNMSIVDVTGQPLLPILDEIDMVIGRPSNILSVARQYSPYISVIGVRKSGFSGSLAEPTQYTDLCDVLWVESAEELDWGLLNKSYFNIEKQPRKDIDEVILSLAEKKINSAALG